MGESKHTPGPWIAVKNESYWQINSERDGQIGDTCASLFSDGIGGLMEDGRRNWQLGEANACLIAAAPELLETVRALLNVVDCGKRGAPEVVDAARALLAKAGARCAT